MTTDKKNNKSKTNKRSAKTVANLRSINKKWIQIHTDFQDSKHKTLTAAIISIFYKVYNALGYGFLE
jgi:hypothetical protein